MHRTLEQIMMARVGNEQALALSVSIRERCQYSSAKTFKSLFILSRYRNDRRAGVLRKGELVGEASWRESRKVALVQGDDMMVVRHLTEYEPIFITHGLRAVDDDDKKVSLGGFASGSLNSD